MIKILLVGSSIFEQWGNAAEAAPEHTVVNRAIGGTVTPYWKAALPAVLREENPDVLWMYCGSNDLCGDTVPNDIADNILACRATASKHNSSMRFAYFSIIKAPQKKGRWEIIDAIHQDLQSRLHPDDLFVDLNELFFVNGEPIHELFIEDGLHLTAKAYDAMVGLTRPIVSGWLNS